MRKIAIFLAASFVSSVGDVLLVTALPQGLGHESGKIQFSVVAWLVPAVAVFVASFFAKGVVKRHNSARTDYALLLLSVAVLEIIVAVLALIYKGPTEALVLIVMFLLGYAFIKEGIPRLLYQVTMYRFFAKESDYRRVVGLKAALDVAGMLAGMLIAAKLVSWGSWRWALIADAVTFVIFGLTLILVGHDYVIDPAHQQKSDMPPRSVDRGSLRWILVTIPFLHSLNALFPNYFPLISEKLGFMNVGSSIVAIAIIRLPGMLMGIFHSRVSPYFSPQTWIRLIPVSYILAGALFLILPCSPTMITMVFVAGLNVGVYNPSDVMIRNQLSGRDLVHFNTLVLRWLAVFQFAACCIAITLYSTGDFNRPAIAAALGGFALLAAVVWKFHEKTIVRGA